MARSVTVCPSNYSSVKDAVHFVRLGTLDNPDAFPPDIHIFTSSKQPWVNLDGRAPAGLAPIAIGLGLTLIHLISIPVTNTSVNPARSTGPALFVGGWALAQLWLFWVAPIIGAVLGALVYRFIGPEDES